MISLSKKDLEIHHISEKHGNIRYSEADISLAKSEIKYVKTPEKCFSDLPDYKILSNYKPPISSRVHSGEGQLIAEYALQKRLFIPYDSIPDKVIYSFLSSDSKAIASIKFLLVR